MVIFMNNIKLVAMWIIIILMGSFIPHNVQGDGIPVTYHDQHEVLRENSQLAFIDVLNETEEDLDLFINVITLDPGVNMTVAVPLRTSPFEMNVTEGSDRQFLSSHGFGDIKETARRQNNNIKHIFDAVDTDEGELVNYIMLGGIFGGMVGILDTWALSFSGSDGPANYHTPGFSVELNSFTTQESLGKFYQGLNMTVPENVKDIIEKYSNFTIALVNFTTRPPIPEDDFRNLTNNFPEVMANLSHFVETHSKISVSSYAWANEFCNGVRNDELQNIYKDFRKSLTEYLDEQGLSDNSRYDVFRKIDKSFNNLVAVIYGYGEMQGYTLSFRLPLFEGKAYFPLGTTPAWSGINKIEVIFRCDSHHSIDLNKEPDYEAIEDGNHYYIYSWTDEVPDYDLEGDYHGADNGWKEKKFALNEWIYEHRVGLLIPTYLCLFLLIVVPVICWCLKRKIGKGEKRTVLHLALTGIFMVPIAGIILSLAVLLMLIFKQEKNWSWIISLLGPAGKSTQPPTLQHIARSSFYSSGAVAGGFFVFISFFFFLNGLYYRADRPDYFFLTSIIFFGLLFLTVRAARTAHRLNKANLNSEQWTILEYLFPNAYSKDELYQMVLVLAYLFSSIMLLGAFLTLSENLGIAWPLALYISGTLVYGPIVLATFYVVELIDRKRVERIGIIQSVSQRIPDMVQYIQWVQYVGPMKYYLKRFRSVKDGERPPYLQGEENPPLFLNQTSSVSGDEDAGNLDQHGSNERN